MPETINTATASLEDLQTFARYKEHETGSSSWMIARMMVNIYVGYLDAGHLDKHDARHMAASVVQSALDNS